MLLPNNKQETKLFETADAARYAYNWTLGKQMEYFEANHKYIPEGEIRRLFTEHKQENEWLYNVSNNATKQAIKDCCKAFDRFMEEKKKGGYVAYSQKQIAKAAAEKKRLGRYEMQWHPKFKKKFKSEPKFYMDTDKIEFTGTHVRLEKIAESKRPNRAKANWVKLAEKERVPVEVKYINPRVSYDGIHWWLSVGVESSAVETETTGQALGVDVGVKDLAVLSDEEKTRYGNINKTETVKKQKKKKRRLQRKISRKYEKNKKGESYRKTGNIIKSEKQRLKIEQRLTGIRHNHLHHASIGIIRQKPSRVVVEDLNIKGMMKNRHLSKAIQEQCLYEFTRQIEYKCSWNSIGMLKADRFYPSSKKCVVCGEIKKDLKLKDRVYKCNHCGNEIDRDYQAALNLARYGAV